MLFRSLYLTHHASKVTLIHRRDSLRAEKILQERLFKHPKIEVVWDSELHDISGQNDPLKVTHAYLKNVKTGAITERAVDGIFIAIGRAIRQATLLEPISRAAITALRCGETGLIFGVRP